MSKNRLTPKLRFPEFVNCGEWEETDLGSEVEIKGRIGYRGYTTSDIVDRGKGAITLSPSNFDENGQLNFTKCTYISWEKYEESPEIILEEGQTVLVKTASVGKTAYVEKLPEKATINPQIVILKPKAINNRFLSYIISHQNTQIQIKNNIGAGAIPNISQAIISKVKIIIPYPKEQQKIASCLSSLDEVIEAHSKKLQLLKDHKKGLMQNLFPQKGEKVPKLRFPEFVNSGEWEEKELDKLLNYEQPTAYLVNSTIYDDTYQTPVLTAGKTFILGYTNEREGIFKNNLPVIIFDDFTTASKFVDFPFKVKSSAMKILLAKNEANIKFVFEAMQMIKFEVGVHKRHWISVFSQLQIPTTYLKEQQKIASCLSALDELITAQTEKIEQLQQHKKGLMQGLFPKMDN